MKTETNLSAYGIYNSKCKKCGLKTKFRVVSISRKRGIKIQCIFCDSIKYTNIKELEQQQNE